MSNQKYYERNTQKRMKMDSLKEYWMYLPPEVELEPRLQLSTTFRLSEPLEPCISIEDTKKIIEANTVCYNYFEESMNEPYTNLTRRQKVANSKKAMEVILPFFDSQRTAIMNLILEMHKEDPTKPLWEDIESFILAPLCPLCHVIHSKELFKFFKKNGYNVRCKKRNDYTTVYLK